MALRKSNPVEPTPASAPEIEPDVPLATDTPTRTSRLRKPSPSAGAGEAVQKADLVPEPEVLDPEPVAEPAASKAPVKDNAVATRPAAKPPITGGLGLVSPFSILKNQIEPGQLAFGSIPRYTATNGQIVDSDKKSVGTWIQFEPVSYNDLYMVAPGSNDDDSKEYLKFSHDGETCDDGSGSLEQAVADAKAAGYEKAAVKKYIELFGILLSGEKIPEGSSSLNKLVMLSLSPESAKAWEGYMIQAAVQVKLGRMSAEDLKVITSNAVVKNYGTTTFTCFNFE